MELGYYKGPFVLLFKESIQVKGFIRVKVTSQGQQKARLALFALEGKGPTLLGRDWLKEI